MAYFCLYLPALSSFSPFQWKDRELFKPSWFDFIMEWIRVVWIQHQDLKTFLTTSSWSPPWQNVFAGMLAVACILELSSQKSHAVDRKEGHKERDTSPERESEVLIWTRTGTKLIVPHLWLQPLNHTVFVSSLKFSLVIHKCVFHKINSLVQLGVLSGLENF